MIEAIHVIGIDCATEPQNVGLSFGCYKNGSMELKDTAVGVKNISIAEAVVSRIDSLENVLIAIDAPLGWPEQLGYNLANHHAGQGLNFEPNLLFRRETDRFIKRKIGKQSLDVGADRIARTAHAALKILDMLRQLTGKSINLAWNTAELKGISVIEVYPAATLDRYGITSTGYKEKEKVYIRQTIKSKLSNNIVMPNDTSVLESNADALDSAVCLLSAKDFIEGNVFFPENYDLAKKEGWIWVLNKKMV